jgi:4-amino-4-deoxy-L-arabinose transferase-like glycosyltransferase
MTEPQKRLFAFSSSFAVFSRKYGVWLIIALALILLLPGSGSIPLIDRDEPRFAEATRGMTQTGEWFVPYFNGNYRFDKPVLTYWVMAPGLMLAQHTDLISLEMGTRLHSVAAAIALGLTVFWMGRRWFSVNAGLLAGLGIVSCFQVVMHGRSAVADMPMVVCVALAQLALYELLHLENANHKRRWFWLLYVALGVGFLAKGPVAWLVPLLSLLLYRFVFHRRKLPWRNLSFLPGLCITLLIVGAWGIPALVKTHGLFWQKGMGEHVFERGFSTMAGFGHFMFYYLATAFISLFPWIAYAGYGFTHLRRNWNSQNAFLVSWIISTYLFFSLYFTQLPHYVMPAFAAVFLILGQLADTETAPKKWADIWFRIVLLIPFSIACLVAVFALLWPFDAPYQPLKPLFLAAAGGLIGLTLLGYGPRRRRYATSALGIALTAVSLFAFGHQLRRVSLTVALQDVLRDMPEDTEYLSVGFNEPGVVFYTGKNWQRQGEMTDEVSEAMRQPGPRAVLLLEREKPLEYFFQHTANTRFGKKIDLRMKDFSAENAALPTNGYETLVLEGANPARTSWATVRLYRRATP